MSVPIDLRKGATALLVAVVLVLAGCRQIAPPPPGAALPWETPAATATPRPDNRVRMLAPWRGEAEAAMRAILDRFEQDRGIRVDYVGYERIPDGLLTEIEAGTVPDVVILPKPNWLSELAAAAAIVPLSGPVEQRTRAHYGPAWIDLATYEDQLFGVPFRANSKSLLWYRPDVLPAGPPTTLPELEAVAARLVGQEDVRPFSVSGAEGWRWPLTDWFENILLAQAGSETYEALAAHEVPWTAPPVRTAARTYRALLRDRWLLGGVDGMQQFGLAESFVEAFDEQPPHAAMWLAQGSVYDALKPKLPGLTPRRDVAVALFPSEGAVVGTVDTAVAFNARPETMALLALLAGPATARPWIEAGGFISPNRDVPLDAYPNAFARYEATQLIEARVFAYDLSDRLPDPLAEELENALLAMLIEPNRIDALLAHLETVADREQGLR